MATMFGLSPMAQVVNIDFSMPGQTLKQGEGVQRFASCSVLKEQIKKADNERIAFDTKEMLAMPMESQAVANSAPATGARDYSETNVQVAGVDEADILKMDGTYVYHLSKNRIMISQILPTESARLIGQIDLDIEVSANDFYIDGDKLMIMGSKYQDRFYPMPFIEGVAREIAPYYPYGGSVTIAQIWDIAQKSSPKKIRTVEFDGSLSSSRMIDGNVYLIMNSWSGWRAFDIMPTEKELVPAYKDSEKGDDFEPMVRCGNVGYFDPQPSREYLTIASVPMHGTGEVNREVILGSSETVYASLQNLYVARQDWQVRPFYDSMVPEDRENTNVYKFKLQSGKIEFVKQGSVPGHLLNQFSLDEHNGYLRAATTIGQVWRTSADSTNNVFILDPDMNPAGSIKGIAPGETIFAMRFMGDKGYMVTFKNIDPFFVLDLKDPLNPKVLGQLKIPGYSDYLHPMDENHIIGVGKEAVESTDKNFAWYQGLKLAVFDVSDVENPIELHKVEIGDRGTESEALQNHKAFMYSPSKQLLALPVRVAELPASVKARPNRTGGEYGNYTFQGAYVYRLTVENGFEELGRITHHKDNQAMLKSGWYYGNYDEDVNRVAYMDDTFLTLSNAGIQMHRLYDLTKQGEIDYPNTDEPGYRDVWE